MTAHSPPMPVALTFAYEAQTFEGQPMTGTIDATDLDAAMQQLLSMGLRVTNVVALSESAAPPRLKALRGDDFLAFNDQLAHLAAAGMPIEQGLRLMAQDLRQGRLANTVRAVADELDRGVSLEQAIAKYQQHFPPLYSRLIEAGAKTGDLSATLLNLGRHVETVQRLRGALWRASAYPLMVFVSLGIVLLLMSWFVFPHFHDTFTGFGYEDGVVRKPLLWWSRANPAPSPAALEFPAVTHALFAFGLVAPWVILALLLSILLAPVLWALLRRLNLDGAFSDAVLLRLPLLGKALRMSLLARWCDALRLGAVAGLDLPTALRLAGDTVRSPELRRDSYLLVAALERGASLQTTTPNVTILPAVVPPMIDLASRSADLPAALQTLSTLYQQQAEVRIRAIPNVITPLLMVIVALLLGFVIAGLLMPMLRLVQYLSGGAL